MNTLLDSAVGIGTAALHNTISGFTGKIGPGTPPPSTLALTASTVGQLERKKNLKKQPSNSAVCPITSGNYRELAAGQKSDDRNWSAASLFRFRLRLGNTENDSFGVRRACPNPRIVTLPLGVFQNYHKRPTARRVRKNEVPPLSAGVVHFPEFMTTVGTVGKYSRVCAKHATYLAY